ncbi:MAG: replication-relaxation family protein [Anaerolinea sp.]|nr:replication-relaxation family protein [Anaerolinea sp.]
MPEKQRQRARRDVRALEPEAIRLTERDIDVMQAVYEYDVLSTHHLQTLFFPSLHSAYSRLASLYHHGFLNRHFLGAATDKMNKPILYVLDQRGVELLRSQRGIEAIQKKRTKDLTFQFLEHTLAINTFRVAIAKAAEQNGWGCSSGKGKMTLRRTMTMSQFVTTVDD